MGNEVINPEDWKTEMALAAKDATQAESTASAFFSTKAGVLSFAGTAVPNNSMEVICLAAVHERVWYPDAYNAARMQSPDCFAFSKNGVAMAPHPEAGKPQNKTCEGCPHDEWGSANNARGKSCKQQRRLALLPAGAAASVDAVMGGIVGVLRIPVTSVKHWSEVVNKIAAATDTPPFLNVIRVMLKPDAKTMVAYTFEYVRTVPDILIQQALKSRAAVVERGLSFPYPRNADTSAGTPGHNAPKF